MWFFFPLLLTRIAFFVEIWLSYLGNKKWEKMAFRVRIYFKQFSYLAMFNVCGGYGYKGPQIFLSSFLDSIWFCVSLFCPYRDYVFWNSYGFKFLARYSTKIFLCKMIGRLKGRVTKVVGEGGTGSGRERWILFTGSVPKWTQEPELG